MQRLIFSLLLLLTATLGIAQNKSFNYWVTGQGSGTNFNVNPPASINFQGANGEDGGCASISDSVTGSVLFFSYGNSIFNRNLTNMPNGTGLNGGESASQPVVIVPSPQRNGKYYVFTTKNYALNNGIYYSVVDMSLDNGNGDVVTNQKNISVLGTPVLEKLTAVMMCNDRDFYVISHERGSDRFIFIPVTSSGVGAPIFVSAGSVIPNNVNASRGVIKVSPDKQRLVCVQNYATNNKVEVFSLNPSATSPTLTNPLSLFTFGGEYGASFSTDNSKLYLSTYLDTTINGNNAVKNMLFQYDLTSASPRIGRNVFTTIENLPFSLPGYFWFGDMNIAPNGKIYLSYGYKSFLIGLSNINGLAANVGIDSALTTSYTTRAGVPNVLTHIYNIPLTAKFTTNTVCFNFPMSFSNGSFTNYSSSLWNFGDPASGANNVSNSNNPTHTYAVPGKYKVTLTVTNSCGISANFSDSVEIFRNLPVQLGNDTSICVGNSVVFDSKVNGATYQWYLLPNRTTPISSSQTISANVSGVYLVNVSNGACNGSDSVQLTVDALKPTVSFPDTSYFCADSTLFLDATNKGANVNGKYAWSNGANSGILSPTIAQKYVVLVSIGACTATDSTVVFQDSLEKISVADQSACPGDPVPFRINPNSGIASILWSNGVSGYAAVYSDSGKHNVAILSKTGCIQRDTFVLKGKCKPFFKLPNAFTPNDDGYNDTLKMVSFGVTELQFEIYNRWNQIVFSTTDPKAGWDGTLKNKECEGGRYFWRAYYKIDVSDPKDINDRLQYQTQTGVITLIR